MYALVVAYLSQLLTGLCGLFFPFMLHRFWKYEAVLYCFLLGLSFISFPVHRLNLSFWRAVWRGAVTGYLAALLSLLCTPLLEGQHSGDFLHGWMIVGRALFLMPIVTLCWLVGICFALTLLAQDRKILTRQAKD